MLEDIILLYTLTFPFTSSVCDGVLVLIPSLMLEASQKRLEDVEMELEVEQKGT